LLNLPAETESLVLLKNRIRNMLWVLAACLIFAAWIAGLFTDLTGDAGLYAAISRQMSASGDWLHLTINGRAYDQKPQLLFWLSGTGISLFGNYNAAFKLFPFLAGLTGIWFTYRLGAVVSGKTAGRIAAIVVGTSQIYFLYLHDIHTDTVLQSAVTLALWQLAAFLKSRKLVNFIMGFMATGLAMLTKGPVGAVIPFFFVVTYLLLERDFRTLFHPRWLVGAMVVLMVISPALYHLYEHFGISGLRFYFIDNNLGRVSGSVAGSNRDPFYYLHNLLWALLPFTVPVMLALFCQIRTWVRTGLPNRFVGALLGAGLVMLLAFSIARGKAPNYMLILIPVLAVVAADWLVIMPARHRRLIRPLMIWQTGVLILMVLLYWLSAFTVTPFSPSPSVHLSGLPRRRFTLASL
jgi:4-amino-4-deoxy-L-arabinose transferase-like glycosyltransferase